MARPIFFCMLLLLLPAAWSLVPQAAIASIRKATRAPRVKVLLGESDESNAEKMTAQVVDKYAVYGRVSDQDQARWIKLNEIEAKRLASRIQGSGAVSVGVVMVSPKMNPTAAGKALEEMVLHPPETLCVLLDNELCVIVGGALGVAALCSCVNAIAEEEWWNAEDRTHH